MQHALTPGSVVVLALDTADELSGWRRGYFLCRGSNLLDGDALRFTRAEADAILAGPNAELFAGMRGEDRVHCVILPTRTYSEGMGSGLFAELAPEDRGVIRALRSRHGERVVCRKIALRETELFAGLPGYLADEAERRRYEEERRAQPAPSAAAEAVEPKFLEFDPEYLRRMKETFVGCMTRPNRQDYMWLLTKTFGLNLAIRLVFMAKGVMSGNLPVARAIASTSWYQLQDAVFTVFGQTYMKFLGRMTGMVKLRRMHIGDFVFVYFQLCGFEFLNRLVLGPLGENPLVYTWSGMGLIFVNILQGMISGGPIIPAINKMRKAGVISHGTMMHLYQLASLTMHFGLFATFGYQWFYTALTTGVLFLSWSAYFVFSTYFKDPEFGRIVEKELLGRIERLALLCYGAGKK